MQLTPRGLPYSEDTDPVSSWPGTLQYLAEFLDGKLPIFDGGTVSFTGAPIDSFGGVTISHNLGVVPTVVIATPSREAYVCSVRNMTATNFLLSFNWNNSSGANYTTADAAASSADASWLAIAL